MPKTKCFDEYYERYEQWFDDNRYTYLSELEAVRHFVPKRGKGIEIGIGSGKFAEPLGIKIGIEPSLNMRKLAEKKGIQTVEGVAEALPMNDSTFNYVLMVTTICFVDDIRQSFREARRILKSGGVIIIGFVDRDSSLGRMYEKNKQKNVFYRDAVFFSTKEVLALLEATGFTDIQAVQTVFGIPSKIKGVQDFKTGFGEGGFVVIKAVKGEGSDAKFYHKA